MTSDPLVSVVIPVFNGDAYLGEAIDSVLGQSYPDLELCVVDDGSTDESGAVAWGYGSRLRYERNDERAGNGAARNRGAATSSSPILAFLDADDRWLPDKLATEMAVLLADAELDGVRSRIREFVSPEIPAAARASIRAPLSGIPALHSYATMRRTAFDRLGGFTTRVRLGVGVDFSTRWEDSGLRSRVLDDVFIERRLHVSNNWARESERVSQLARTIKDTLDRRRAGTGESPRGGG